MQLALNGFTTAHCDLVTDIEIAQETGFEFLEIRVEKLRRCIEDRGMVRLSESFQQSGIKPLSINALENILFRDKAGFSVLERDCRELCEAAAVLGCPYIIAVPSRGPEGADRDTIREESIKVLSRLGKMAEDYGVSLSFEFMGFGWCAVNNLKECSEIVRAVDRPNVGLVLDVFHFFAGRSSLDDIRETDTGKLHIVHMNDAPDAPPEQQEDRIRLLPGEGIIPLRDILRVIEDVGYDGAFSVEVLNEDYWQRDPVGLCKEARDRTLALLSK